MINLSNYPDPLHRKFTRIVYSKLSFDLEDMLEMNLCQREAGGRRWDSKLQRPGAGRVSFTGIGRFVEDFGASGDWGGERAERAVLLFQPLFLLFFPSSPPISALGIRIRHRYRISVLLEDSRYPIESFAFDRGRPLSLPPCHYVLHPTSTGFGAVTCERTTYSTLLPASPCNCLHSSLAPAFLKPNLQKARRETRGKKLSHHVLPATPAICPRYVNTISALKGAPLHNLHSHLLPSPPPFRKSTTKSPPSKKKPQANASPYPHGWNPKSSSPMNVLFSAGSTSPFCWARSASACSISLATIRA